MTATQATSELERARDRLHMAAHEAGMSVEQLGRFLDAGIILRPRQLSASVAARECDEPNGPRIIGYGGARGGGKSAWMMAQVGADDCQRYPGLKCLLLRKIGKANREAVDDLRRTVFAGLRHEYKRQEGVITFANGSRIILGHFKDEKDIDAYLGLEYDIIGVEEATTLTIHKLKMIGTCCRTSKPGWQPRQYWTFNPGGVSHAYVKQLLIEPNRKDAETDTRFIKATVRDNTFVNTDYRKTLESLTGWQRRAWLDGDWDIAAGQFFTTWRHERHVVPSIHIKPHWDLWLSMDYGFTHWNVVYLMGKDGDGGLYVIDEHAARRTLIEQHHIAILRMLERNGIPRERISRFVAGGDVWNARHDGTTIEAEYAKRGWRLTPADDRREAGAAEILRRLGDVDADPTIEPTIQIHQRCTRLIECLPSLQHNPNRPEDVLKVDTDDEGTGGDDPYDAFRYGIMSAARGMVRVA